MVLVTGCKGQLGFDVINELKSRNIDCIGVSRNEFDITDKVETEKYILNLKPDCIVHCAAYTKVDDAEDNQDLCYKVNVEATENIAKCCKRIDAKMIYISTDYVFDGIGNTPHETYEKPNPQSVYGMSKYLGELKVQENLLKYFIVRISWVFGENGNNFVKTMLRLGKEKESINVVSDQIGSPTYTKDLAKLLCDMAQTGKYGVYHAANEGYCSWAEFAEEIMIDANLKCKINYIKSSEYKSKAVRPLNSRLSMKSLEENGFRKLPEWKKSLSIFLNNTNKKNNL